MSMDMEHVIALKNALMKMGFKGRLTARMVSHERAEVRKGGERIGIWCFQKNTFVD